MWYVIQTLSGKEHELCLWINTYVDKSLYERCFVPLYEDVWRKEGIGHISIKKLFPGYLFVETDKPEQIHEALKEKAQFTMLLSMEDKGGKIFVPLHSMEEEFFDSILSDGLMKVSYIHRDRSGKFDIVIGPLQLYIDRIVRIDLPHRRAIVDIPFLGEDRKLKFGLWLDNDPKQDWIEQEKKNRTQNKEDNVPTNHWDWKAWKKINDDRRKTEIADDIYGYKVGDDVINTTGIYGDIPLKIAEIRPDKNSVIVNVMLFGSSTKVEMRVEDIMLPGNN